MKIIKLFLAFSLLCSVTSAYAADTERISILTTLSTFASIAEEIGGAEVDVKSVAAPQFNPHFIEPKPSDILRLKRADLFVHAGLDLEAWRQPLVDASARAEVRAGGARELDLSPSVTILNVPEQRLSRADGDIHLFGNPHYWLDPENAIKIAKSIASKLCELSVNQCQTFKENAARFTTAVKAKVADWEPRLQRLRGKNLIAYHDEWIYLTSSFGGKIVAFIEPKPGIPPTPKHLETLLNLIKTSGTIGIIQSSYYPKDSADLLTKETGVKLAQLCQNVGELPSCKTYPDMMDYNFSQLESLL